MHYYYYYYYVALVSLFFITSQLYPFSVFCFFRINKLRKPFEP